MQSGILEFVVFAVFLVSCIFCDVSPLCKVNEILCVKEGKCVPLRYRCDGGTVSDCDDDSDELYCVSDQCSDHKLRCNSGDCVPKILFCDGRKDCRVDGSDELDCGYEDSDIIFFNEGHDIYMKTRTKAGLEFTNLLPISIRLQRTGYHNGMKITGLSFDVRSWTLFISDIGRPAIFTFNATSLDMRDLITDGITSPMDIAFDYASNNLYWVDSGTGVVGVVSVDTLRRIVIVRYLSNPVSLALSPKTGTMFIATTGIENSVFMYGMDGSNRRILDRVQGSPASIALHPTKRILYWTDLEEGTVSYVNYAIPGQPKILKKNIGRVMSVAATERDIYITSGEPIFSERVLRIKNLGREKEEGWKSITVGMKPHSGKYECLIDNGGCDYLCLTSESGRTCACSSKSTLSKDGKSC